MYSIDKNIKTFSMQQAIDKGHLENDGQRIIEWTRREVMRSLVDEMVQQGQTNFVVSLHPEHPGGNFTIVVGASAIPGEYRRMLKRIDELENEVLVLRHRNASDLYAPVYNIADRSK